MVVATAIVLTVNSIINDSCDIEDNKHGNKSRQNNHKKVLIERKNPGIWNMTTANYTKKEHQHEPPYMHVPAFWSPILGTVI